MAILTSMNGYLDAQMTWSRYKVFNHTHTPISSSLSKGRSGGIHNCSNHVLNGPEATPEGRSLTPPTPAPPCSSLSPTLNNTPTDHQKPTGSPQPIPLKIKHSTTPNVTQCIRQHSAPTTTHSPTFRPTLNNTPTDHQKSTTNPSENKTLYHTKCHTIHSPTLRPYDHTFTHLSPPCSLSLSWSRL